MVLLKNQGALPLPKATRTAALFGNASYAMVTGGTGSGDVNEAYTVSLVEGLKGAGIVADPKLAAAYEAHIADQQKKAPRTEAFMLPAPLAQMTVPAGELARLARETDLGLITVGRISGEFVDRKKDGDFNFTDAEKALIKDVTAAFHARQKKAIVVLNIGGVVETATWRDAPDAILVAWQPGQESGNAISDVLTGKAFPSGKLATTFPMKWEACPRLPTSLGRCSKGRIRTPRGGSR